MTTIKNKAKIGDIFVMDVTKIDIQSLPELPGLVVYDVETGKKIETAHDIDTDCYYYDSVMIDEDGLLIVKDHPYDGEPQYIEIPKIGKYVIQLGDKLFRW